MVLALTTIAQKDQHPYPIFLVLGGLVLGMVPGLPTVTLHPDLCFWCFPADSLGGRLFHFVAGVPAEPPAISLLAVGLVLATTAGSRWLAHALLPGIRWGSDRLGAIVSPPDAVSAIAIGKRLRIPRRVVTIWKVKAWSQRRATALVFGTGLPWGRW